MATKVNMATKVKMATLQANQEQQLAVAGAKKAGFGRNLEDGWIQCTHCEGKTSLLSPDNADHSLECRYHAKNQRSVKGVFAYTILTQGFEKEIAEVVKFRGDSTENLETEHLSQLDGPVVNVAGGDETRAQDTVRGYCQDCQQHVADNVCLPCGCINLCDPCYAQRIAEDNQLHRLGSITEGPCGKIVRGIFKCKFDITK